MPSRVYLFFYEVKFRLFFGKNHFLEVYGQYTLAASLNQRIQLKDKGLFFFKIVKLIVTCDKF
jgi:hypothetical protein